MEPETAPATQPPQIFPEAENVPEVNQPSPEVKANRQFNKWLIASLIIFAVAALIAAGVFVYQYFQSKQSGKPEVASSAPTSSPTANLQPSGSLVPTSTAGSISNWVTYADLNFCYIFKYPPQIEFKLRPEEKIVHLSLVGPTQKQDTEFFDGISLSFSYPLEISGTTLSDYVDSQIEESKQTGEITKPKETITVNGINGYTYTASGLGTFRNIYLQSTDKTCTVEIVDVTIDPTNQGYPQTVEKILSTFEFK